MVILLGILKLVAGAVTAFFGGYGLLHDFRRHGKVTREGKIALYGGIIAGFLTVTSQVLETYKQRFDDQQVAQKSQDQIDRSNELMTQVLRGVYPLKDATFDVDFDFTPNEPYTIQAVAAYRRRLDQEVATLERTRRFTKAEYPVADNATSSVVGVVLKDGSQLLPRHTTSEEVPWLALHKFSYHFEFYNKVRDEKSIGTQNPNLSFDVIPERREFAAGLSGMLQIETHHAGVTSFYHDDGSIGGLKDLSDVIVVFELFAHGPTDDVNTMAAADNVLLRSSSINSIVMHIGAKNCFISGSRLEKRTPPAPGWWFRLGKDTLKECSLF